MLMVRQLPLILIPLALSLPLPRPPSTLPSPFSPASPASQALAISELAVESEWTIRTMDMH